VAAQLTAQLACAAAALELKARLVTLFCACGAAGRAKGAGDLLRQVNSIRVFKEKVEKTTVFLRKTKK